MDSAAPRSSPDAGRCPRVRWARPLRGARARVAAGPHRAGQLTRYLPRSTSARERLVHPRIGLAFAERLRLSSAALPRAPARRARARAAVRKTRGADRRLGTCSTRRALRRQRLRAARARYAPEAGERRAQLVRRVFGEEALLIAAACDTSSSRPFSALTSGCVSSGVRRRESAAGRRASAPDLVRTAWRAVRGRVHAEPDRLRMVATRSASRQQRGKEDVARHALLFTIVSARHAARLEGRMRGNRHGAHLRALYAVCRRRRPRRPGRPSKAPAALRRRRSPRGRPEDPVVHRVRKLSRRQTCRPPRQLER